MGTSWFTRQAKRTAKQQYSTSARPRLEVLEDRIALATRVWDGNALSNNWTNAINWQFNIAPVPGDDLVFPTGVSDTTADNNFPDGTVFRSITISGGYTLKGNSISIGIGGIIASGSGLSTIRNDVNLPGVGRDIRVDSNAVLKIEGVVSGTHVTKLGSGELIFASNNTYTGLTKIIDGKLSALKEGSLGTTTFGTVLGDPNGTSSGAQTLSLGDFNLIASPDFDEKITVYEPMDSTLELLDSVNLRGELVLERGLTVIPRLGELSGSPTISGVISGPAGFTLNNGTLTLSGNQNNTFESSISLGQSGGGSPKLILNKPNGTIAVPNSIVSGGGDIIFRGSNQLRSTATIFKGIGKIELGGHEQTLKALDLRSGKLSTSSLVGSGLLVVTERLSFEGTIISGGRMEFSGTIDYGLSNEVFSGDFDLGTTTKRITLENPFDLDLLVTSSIQANIRGTAGMIKDGPGTLTLSGNNSYSGSTVISEGSLIVNGNQPNSQIFVNPGAKLFGTGTVGTLTVNNAGILNPGTTGTHGVLKVNGNLNMLPGSRLQVSLNGPVAGSGHDQVDIQGTGLVNIAGAILEPTVLAANAFSGDFRIINNNNADAIIGQFVTTVGETIGPGTAFFTPTGDRFVASYLRGLNGNDLVLTRTNAGALFPNRSVTPQIVAGGVVTLTGIVSDPDRKDSFILHINWGDGSPVETKVFGPTFNGKQVFLRHRYLTSQVDPYVIQLNWHDQRGAGNSDTLTTLVTASARAAKTTDAIFTSLLSLKEKKSLNFIGN